MIEILKNPQSAVPLCFFLACAVVAIVSIICVHWKRVRQLEIEASLKQDMLNRGLSVEDIERVLQSSSEKPSAVSENREKISVNELVEKMIDEGRSVDEIERLVRACKEKDAGSAIPEGFTLR